MLIFVDIYGYRLCKATLLFYSSNAGDVLGPVFSPTSPKPFTVYDLWGIVFLNGEQNMFQMAYNMLMLKYLKLSNQLRPNVRDTILAAICRCESRDVFSLLVLQMHVCLWIFVFVLS